MSHLSTETLNRIKGMLDARERELLADVKREEDQKDEYRQVSSDLPDPGDNSFADLTTDLDNAAIGRDVIELRAIGRARERLANGSYGTCIDCGDEIPEQRLLAQPIAERCARDQDHYERLHPGGALHPGSARGGTL